MAEIEKLMNVAIGDIEKIMNIATDDIEKVMGVEVPASAVWTGTRGVIGGGVVSGSNSNVIDYKTISSTGAMSDFGDLSTAVTAFTACSNGTRGLFLGGYDSGGEGYFNRIEYITVGSTGDVTDAGDLTQGKLDITSSSNGTRALVWAGADTSGSYTELDEIDYVTIDSTSNASDFGDISTGAIESQGGAINDATYGLRYQGTLGSTNWDVMVKYIDYVTISTTGNTSDFGDMTVEVISGLGGCSNTTRGVSWGGRTGASTDTNIIGYVTIASAGDASDFGDVTIQAQNNGNSGNGAVSNLTKGECYGGFSTGGSAHQNIDYITIASTGNATSAGDDLTAATYHHSSLSGT